MITKPIIDQYTTYIDTSQMIIEYYKNRTTTGLEHYYLKIENWLSKETKEEENIPLVIEAHEGVGKKTALIKWMEYHQNNSKKSFKDYIIPIFPGTGNKSTNYCYAIYRILVQIREFLNISQKVEMLEEKLKRYFNYWLGLANKTLEDDVANDANIIILLEGIHLFKDPETGDESILQLWLPRIFPKRIKVIVTCDQSSQSMKYLENLKCEIIELSSENSLHHNVIDSHLAKASFIIDEEYKTKLLEILKNKSDSASKSLLFIKTYLSVFLPYVSDQLIDEKSIDKEKFKTIFSKVDFGQLEKINDINSLNKYMLEYFENNICDPKKFKATLTVLTLTDKGLTFEELQSTLDFTNEEWCNIVAIFKNYLMKYRNLWKISNEIFRKIIIESYIKNNNEFVQGLHIKIADSLKKTPNSIRKLEEETYHLFKSQSYFRLKESVSNVENFLLLFNPNTKYDLCRYWQLLETKGFDPASEYNKAVEGYELHYHPTNEDTFIIILQISRFFKEFSDFETNFTPEFRHPPIKSRGGNELKEIGLRLEFKKMKIYASEDWEEEENDQDEIEEIEYELTKKYNEIDQLDKQLGRDDTGFRVDPKKVVEEIFFKKKLNSPVKHMDKLDDSKLSKDLNRSSMLKSPKGTSKIAEFLQRQNEMKKEPPILNQIESLNTDIPENQEKFRAYFGGLRPRLKNATQELQKEPENYMDTEDEQEKEKDKTKNEEEEDKQIVERNDLPYFSHEMRIQSSVFSNNKKVPKSKKRLEIDPTFYYYKRWLWIMFPWVCLSSNKNYSKIISECYSSATKYMTVEDEKAKALEALKIALSAKLKKQLVLSNEPGTKSSVKIKRILSPPPKIGSPTSQLSDQISAIFEKSPTNSNTKKIQRKILQISGQDSSSFLSPPKYVETLTTKSNSNLQNNNNHDSGIFITNLNILNKSEMASEPNDTFLHQSNFLSRSRGAKDKISLLADMKIENMLKNASQAQSAMLLPLYQDSIQTLNKKQLSELDEKVESLHRTMDDIKHQNQILNKDLARLKIMEDNLIAQQKSLSETKILEKKIEIEQHFDKAKQQLDLANQQKDRLTKIISICQKNKKHNQLWIKRLNFLAQNINKTLNRENDEISSNNMIIQDLMKIHVEMRKALDEKRENHRRLINHLQNQREMKEIIDEKVDFAYKDIEKVAVDIHEKLVENGSNLSSPLKRPERSEKHKISSEESEEVKEILKKMEKLKEIDSKSTDFQSFIDGISKYDELRAARLNKEVEISKMENELAIKKNTLDILKKAVQYDTKLQEIAHPYAEIDDRDRLKKLIKEKQAQKEIYERTKARESKIVLQANISFSRICGKNGIKIEPDKIVNPQLPVEFLLQNIMDKISTIKNNLTEEDYAKFEKGEYVVNYPNQKMLETASIAGSFSSDKEPDVKPSQYFRMGNKLIEYNTTF